ncbi:DNA adenine methylase [Ferruginibacter albus]|uniref:DNA adenine methylase n=1 Tax=Ferruginibacter albus TaxID=2875540 RepID=UPI001CC7C179|nr:DNA adenine methylase [Ferruginibacter albus]UAY53594.1 DNA adenine methylase [Ferruginibacter albus]
MNNSKITVTHNISGRSLLRYPGGKTRAVPVISHYFPKNLTELVSPFLGGGSLELHLAANGVNIYGYDLFNPLVEFWQCALKQPDELADKVQSFFPLSKDKFYELQQTQTSFKTKLERAAVYYVLNRSSFSGATLSGGMSPQHPRFTQSSIDRLRNFYNPNLTVKKLHFEDSIKLHTKDFLYLDPPYLIESSLYGKKGDAHKDFDHTTLAKILKGCPYWILSYNDHNEIRELYSSYKIINPKWVYGMSNNKASKEILVFSKKLSQRL